MTEKLTEGATRLLELMGKILVIGVPVISLTVYFAQIGPTMSDQAGKIADLKLAQVEQRVRVDRIEESRNQGLQRLSAVEEASKAAKAAMDQINAKLDRLLFERRR
jgi:hypothetical protein